MAGRTLRVAFIGSGAVNFGGVEGSPWDHASRLEQLSTAGFTIEFVAIADPLTEKAEEVLALRRSGVHAHLYESTKVFGSYKDMLEKTQPTLVFIGIPPIAHGCFAQPVELDCLNAGSHVFVEKPISMSSVAEVDGYSQAVVKLAAEKHLCVSVGYMFRYAKAVDKVRELIQQHARGHPIAIIERYNCAYNTIDHPFWWDERRSGGPIVEQATHFVDLAFYLANNSNVVQSSCTGLSVPAVAAPLAIIPPHVDENIIPEQHRLPRVTMANWKFENGTVVSLTHGLLLQGLEYEATIEVWCDGLRVELLDPYNSRCRVRARVGQSDEDIEYPFPQDDMYYNEDSIFLQAVVSSDYSIIRCPFDVASKTYAMTQLIREITTTKH